MLSYFLITLTLLLTIGAFMLVVVANANNWDGMIGMGIILFLVTVGLWIWFLIDHLTNGGVISFEIFGEPEYLIALGATLILFKHFIISGSIGSNAADSVSAGIISVMNLVVPACGSALLVAGLVTFF